MTVLFSDYIKTASNDVIFLALKGHGHIGQDCFVSREKTILYKIVLMFPTEELSLTYSPLSYLSVLR